MARPRKTQTQVKTEDYGKYTLTKPHDHYVIKLGNSVVFVSKSEDEARKYIELLTKK